MSRLIIKEYLYTLFLLILCYSCNSEKGNSTPSVKKKPKPTYGRNYYWEKSDQNRFIAISFDSTDNIYCTLYSFGNKEEENEKRYLVRPNGTNIYELSSLDSNRIQYEIKITTNKSLVLSTPNQPVVSYTMIINDNFQKLFGEVKSKFQFKCVSSDEIVFNGIVCYKTTVNEISSNPIYKKRIESYNDEIYGSGEFHYLDYNGNKFYYTNEGNESIFSKIEIFNNKMESWYLDIKIGDPIGKAMKKLENKSVPFDRQSKSLYVRICNSVSEGTFGHLIFSFDKKLSESSAVLSKITYEPFYDGE